MASWDESDTSADRAIVSARLDSPPAAERALAIVKRVLSKWPWDALRAKA